ncbi:MAG: hypothetical protein ACRD1E_03545, partial [Terriglobales bacterium]
MPLLTVATVAQVNYPPVKVMTEHTVLAASNPYLGPATNLHLEFPIFSRPTGGTAQLGATLVYDSQFWGAPSGRWQPQAGNGWWLRTAGGQLNQTEYDNTCGWESLDGSGDDGSGSYSTYYLSFQEPDGTMSAAIGSYTVLWTVPQEPPPPGYYDTTDCPASTPLPQQWNIADGKGFKVEVDEFGTATAWDGAGDEVDSGFADRNGNSVRLSGSSYLDPLGTALTVGGSPSSTVTYAFPGPGGAPQTITIPYESIYATANFGCYSAWSGYLRVPASIQYPDGRTYTFTYDAAGRLASMTEPGGGVVSYSYYLGVLCSPFYITDGLDESDSLDPGLNWDWAHNTDKNQTVQTDPYGGRTTTTFDSSGNPTQVDAGNTYNGPIVTRTVSTGSVYNRISTVELCVSQTDPCGSTDTAKLESSHQVVRDGLGNPASTQDTDWGVNAPGAVLRKTANTYQASGNGEVLASAEVEDGSNNQTALTQFTSFDGNGNPLTRQDWVSTGGGKLTTTFAYNANGTLSSVTAPNGAQTSYTNYACSGAFPQTVTNSIGSVSASWDCFGGVETGSTDLNGEHSIFGFDNFWRPTSITAPDGSVTSISYPSAGEVERAMTFNGGQSTVDVATEFDGLGRPALQQRRQAPNGGTYDTVQTTFDAMGRVATVSRPYAGGWGAAPPAGTKVTTTSYDALSRPVKIVDGGGGEADISYPLDDVLTTVQGAVSAPTVARQEEMDGLGRLASVCELTAGTSAWPAGSCNQRSAASGYLTAYTRDTLGDITGVAQDSQPGNGGVESRSFAFDELGRLISEWNPESKWTYYTFDGDSACGTGASDSGSLVKRVDNAGNVTCYLHDALGRVTTLLYPS